MIDALRRLLDPLTRKINLIIGRGVVNLTNDANGIQTVQLSLLADEVRDDIQRIQNYGFTSNPQNGAEVVTVFLGGDRENGISIACEDRRYRIKNLAQGEVAIYDDLGSIIKLQRGGNIQVSAPTKITATAPNVEIVASAKVTITSPLVETSAIMHVKGALNVDGNATVTGTSTLTGLVTAPAGLASATALSAATLALTGGTPISDVGAKILELKTKHNIHTHQENGTGGGITNPTTDVVS